MNATPAAAATDLYEIAERTLPGAGLGGYSLPDDVRFVIARGQGNRVQSTDGRWYLDYTGGAGANILGHCHPAVVEAVQRQSETGLHYFGTLNDTAIELSEVLVETIPCAEKVLFTTTGSEATSYAFRIARAATGKDRILKFEGAYHGNHDYASFSQFPTAAANYPMATADSGGVPRALQDTMFVAPYNDLDAVERILAEHAHEIAAIIVEPIQRIIFPTDGFLAGLRTLCDRFGVILIFDEVVTGFRLALGGAQEYFGVQPDLATYGKIVGGGGPLGAVAGRADLIDLTNPRNKGRPNYAYINGTLHGNPVAAAAGLATIRELMKPGTYEGLHAGCDRLLAACREVLERRGVPAIAVGRASFWQILFASAEPRNQIDVLGSDIPAMRKLDLEWIRQGVYVLPGVRRFTSAILSDDEIAETIEALDGACTAI
jgi:glutamate-1-semialdehyde 2,1-aminomutase